MLRNTTKPAMNYVHSWFGGIEIESSSINDDLKLCGLRQIIGDWLNQTISV